MVPISDLEPGVSARLVAITGGRRMIRRCLGLGLRVGSEVAVSQRRGSGFVVESSDNRVALGHDVAQGLLVEARI